MSYGKSNIRIDKTIFPLKKPELPTEIIITTADTPILKWNKK